MSPSLLATRNYTPSRRPALTCTAPHMFPSPSTTRRIANGPRSLAMPAAVTPPPALSTPSPVGASPSVGRVARHPRHCAPTPVAPANPPSHPLTSPWSSAPPLTPFPTSVFPPTTSPPAASGQAGPWPYFVARSTPTPSVSWAAGNRTRCSGTCMTEFRQPLQVQSHLEMPGILVQLGHTQRT